MTYTEIADNLRLFSTAMFSSSSSSFHAILLPSPSVCSEFNTTIFYRPVPEIVIVFYLYIAGFGRLKAEPAPVDVTGPTMCFVLPLISSPLFSSR